MSVRPINQDIEVRSSSHQPRLMQGEPACLHETFEAELRYRATQRSRGRLRGQALLAACALAFAFGLTRQVYSWGTVRQVPMESYHTFMVTNKKSELDVAQLILDWRNLWDQVVVVKGTVQCDEEICWFGTPPGFHKFVAINISMLPLERRRHIVLGCQASECSMVVTGRAPYGDGMFMAYEVADESH